VIDRFLPHLAELLSPRNGLCYMVLVADNKPKELQEILKTRYEIVDGYLVGILSLISPYMYVTNRFRMSLEVIAKKKAANESLMVARIEHMK